jgi:hypothetical protein
VIYFWPLRRRLNHVDAAALGTEHGGAPWSYHMSSPDLQFAHARTTQPQVFSVVRDQDSAGNSPRGTTSGEGHREMARDGGRLVLVFGSVGGEFQVLLGLGSGQKGVVRHPQARRGVAKVQNAVER